MKKILFLIGFLLFTGNCYAENNFKCKVKESFKLDSNGKLSAKSDVAKNKLNKEFIVNRQTGQMTGNGFINTMSGVMPKVYNYLPNENSFKSITIYKPNYTVDYLEINEYVKNKEKPFLFKSAWGIIVTGLCTYY